MPNERGSCAPSSDDHAEPEHSACHPCNSQTASSVRDPEGAVSHSPDDADRDFDVVRHDPRVRRRDRRQRISRVQEQRTRQRVLRRAAAAKARGVSWKQLASSLDVSERTLRHWRQTNGSCQLQRRGRPCIEVPADKRSQVFRFLQLTGPMIGLPALRAVFRDLPRATLKDQLVRYRRWWRKKHAVDGQRLTWLVPRTVWAMDFTECPFKVDGRYRYLFTVRDLASHYHLCWEPVSCERADEVIPILQRLFADHGRPLVMKSDNGSAFIAEPTREFFKESEVAVLYSPPRKPKYNGALERSNTTMKSFTACSAQSAGHPLHWTSDDLASALRMANDVARPWGHDGPTPAEAFRGQAPVTDQQRQQLMTELQLERVVARERLGFNKLEDGELRAADERQIDRVALSPIVQRLGYLKLTKVRRAAEKPKRPARDLTELQDAAERAAVAAHCCVPNDSMLVGAAPMDAAVARSSPLAKAAMRALPSARASEIGTPKNLLARTSEGATMQGRQEAINLQAASPQATTPKHRARAIFTWLRRPIALLVSVFKAAKIT